MLARPHPKTRRRRVPAAGLVAPLLACLLLGAPRASATVWPTSGWIHASPEAMGLDSVKLAQARDYAIAAGGGSGFIARGGRAVMTWGTTTGRYDLKSTTKSIGVTVLGLAVQDGLVALADSALAHYAGFGVPPDANATTGWLDDITIEQLATHTAGFAKPGGFIELSFAPGTTWAYSDGGANWLADVLTIRYGQDLQLLFFARVLDHLGVTASEFRWRDNAYRGTTIEGIPRREFGSGINASVDAMARIGYLYLRGGVWDGQQIIPSSFVAAARTPSPAAIGRPVANPAQYSTASQHYGLLWWNNADGVIPGVPTDTYWAWGLEESFIIVIPSLDLVVARAGSAWQDGTTPLETVLAPFLTPIVEAVVAPPSNQAPLVAAGSDRALTLPTNTLALAGLVQDDDLPTATLTTQWTLVAGPGSVTFDDPYALSASATFDSAGIYQLRLTADDGMLSASDDLLVVVNADPASAIVPSYLGFDGIDDYALLSDPGTASALDLAADFTIEAWVRFNSLPTSGVARNPRILQKSANTSSAGSYYLAARTSTLPPVLSLRLKFGGATYTLDGATALATDRWYHTAAVKEGASVRLYLDGVQDGPAFTVPSGAPDANNDPLYIGEGPSNSDGALSGSIDDVRLYDRALSADEIASTKGIELSGAEPGLVLCLPLNEGAGQSVGSIAPGGLAGWRGAGESPESTDPAWGSDLDPTAVEVDTDGPTDPSRPAAVPLSFELHPLAARGGPAVLTIRSSRPVTGSLDLFDVQGRLVKTLLSGAPIQAGTTTILWRGETEQGAAAASGVYFARLRADGETLVRRILRIK